MIVLMAGLCLKGDNTICPAGSTEIPAVFAASAAFIALALIGFIWLGFHTKR